MALHLLSERCTPLAEIHFLIHFHFFDIKESRDQGMQLKCNSKLDTVTQTEQSRARILPQEALHIAPSLLQQSWRLSLTPHSVFWVNCWLRIAQNPDSFCGMDIFFFHERIFHSVCVCKNVEEKLYPAAFWQISMSSGNANSSGWFSSASYKKKGRWSYEQICALRQKVVYLQDVMEQCNAALVGFSLRQFEKRADFESLGISCMASLEGKAFKAIL